MLLTFSGLPFALRINLKLPTLWSATSATTSQASWFDAATMFNPTFEGSEIVVESTDCDRSDALLHIKVTALLIASCAPFSTGAQQGPAALETLVVSGTRVPDSTNAPGAITVLDAAIIETRNDSDVLDLLSDVPGVHVNLPGSRGNVGEVFLRGGEPNFTVVLIDGIQVNDPTNTRGGSFDFSTLNVDDIERIEVLRGPSSSIYGSDALSGVINVVTHGGTDALTSLVDAEVGGGDYQRGGLRVRGPAAGSSRFSVGVGIIEDGNSDSPDRFRGDSVTAKLDLAQDNRTSVSIYARHATADSSGFPDSSGGPRLAVIREKASRESEDNALSLALTSRWSPRTNVHFAATTYDHQEQAVSPGVAPGSGVGIPANRSDNDFSRTVLNLFLTSELMNGIDAAFGLGYQQERGESAGQIMFAPQFVLPTRYALSRDDLSAYGELAFSTDGGVGLVAGVRTDEMDTAGRETTGRLALEYAFPNSPLRVRLGWGNAFKIPSLFALADPLVGNPSLRPEVVESWEMGLDLQALADTLRWQITAFRQRFEDLIDFDFDTFTTVNRSRVNTNGIELGAQYQPTERLSLTAHATYTDIDVLDSVVVLRQRPDLRGGVGLLWTIYESLTAHAGWQYIGERFDSSIPTGEQLLPSYSRLDLTVTWKLGDTIRLSFAVDNIADAEYEEAIGFPSVGRRVRLSAQISLSQHRRSVRRSL
jgi:iron complex outermembrane receptor protein/vitamin B12 transporter